MTIVGIPSAEWSRRQMEVIPSTAGGSGAMPFQRHNVEEWSRLDSLTGMLEHARVESGQWAASTSNSSQHYGKVRKHTKTLPTITILLCPPMKCLCHQRVFASILLKFWPMTEFHETWCQCLVTTDLCILTFSIINIRPMSHAGL
jgi:hypothetical protein